MKTYLPLIIISFLLQATGFSQSRVDSLLAEQEAKGTTNDSASFWRLIELTQAMQQENLAKSREYANDALSVARKMENVRWQMMGYNLLAISHALVGESHQALAMFEKCLELDSSILGTKNLGSIYNNIGTVSMEIGEFDQAIAYLMKGLELRESVKIPFEIAGSCNNIGLCYYEQDQNLKALEYYNRCIDILITDKDTLNDLYTSALNNIGLAYVSSGKHELSLPYYQRSVKIDEATGMLHSASYGYNYMGDAYSYLGEYDKAFEYFEKGIEISIKLQDPYGEQMGNVSIANCYIDQKMYGNSIDLLKNASDYYASIDDKISQQEVLRSLAAAYRGLNNWKAGFIYIDSARRLGDSIHQDNFTQAIADIQGKYDFDQQKARIEMLDKQNQLDQAMISEANARKKSQDLFIWIIGIALFAAMVVIGLIAYSLIRKRRDNRIISEQKSEAEKQRDIAEEQKQIAHVRSLEIAEKHQEITDSINYGKRIQDALLTSGAYWQGISSDHFILFQPKDIVSGDFYWAYREGETVYWVVADCTGHGVPGAFMSMLGISFLNEIIIENNCSEPSEILNSLRVKIIKALDNEDLDVQQRDGMDIALCKLNTRTNEIEYAGANNALWILRSEPVDDPSEHQRVFSLPNEAAKIIEIHADKQPVGSFGEVLTPFTTKRFNLRAGDRIYAFTDGYADQFGGSKGKKLKPKALKSILINSAHLEMSEQKEQLLTSLSEWKRDFEQVDDICIVGIEI